MLIIEAVKKVKESHTMARALLQAGYRNLKTKVWNIMLY